MTITPPYCRVAALAAVTCLLLPGCLSPGLDGVLERLSADLADAEARAHTRSQDLRNRMIALEASYAEGFISQETLLEEQAQVWKEQAQSVEETFKESLGAFALAKDGAKEVAEEGIEQAKATAKAVGFSALEVLLSALGGAGALGAGIAGSRRLVAQASAQVNAERDAARIIRGERTGTGADA